MGTREGFYLDIGYPTPCKGGRHPDLDSVCRVSTVTTTGVVGTEIRNWGIVWILCVTVGVCIKVFNHIYIWGTKLLLLEFLPLLPDREELQSINYTRSKEFHHWTEERTSTYFPTLFQSNHFQMSEHDLLWYQRRKYTSRVSTKQKTTTFTRSMGDWGICSRRTSNSGGIRKTVYCYCWLMKMLLL